MYKVTFKLKNGLSYTFNPVFDAILAHRLIHKKLGFVPNKIDDETFDLLIQDLPLKKNAQGYCASEMFLSQAKVFKESKQFFTKRFEFQNAALIRAAERGTIDTKRGDYKDFKLPVRVVHVEQVYFFFDTNNIDKCAELINSITHLGKKSSQGFGEVSEIAIEEEKFFNFDEHVLRPIPLELLTEKHKTQGGDIEYRTYKMPYHDLTQATSCLVASSGCTQ